MKKSLWIISIIAIFSLVVQVTVFGEEISERFPSLEDELDLDHTTLEEIRTIIIEQAKAIAEINGIDIEEDLRSIDVQRAIKVSWIKTSSPEESIQKFSETKRVLESKCKGGNSDPFNALFLEYYWRVPVVKTDKGTIYASVVLGNANGPSVSSIFVPPGVKDYSEYVFNYDAMLSATDRSNYFIERGHVIPVSIPSISTDIILFADSGEVFGIPYSAQDVFLQLENGKVYPYSVIESALKSRIEIPAEDKTGEPSGGGFGSTSVGLSCTAITMISLLSIAIVAIICTISIAAFSASQSRKKRAID